MRKHLTYSNVMSSLAIFLVLGGGTAVAVNQLAKNSVGPKQLKKNAVTTAKLKKNAVAGAKIKAGAVSTDKIGADAVTGNKVNESTLGEVPSAATAKNAIAFERFVPFGLITAASGESKTLVSYGPFSLIGRCALNGGSLEAEVVFATTEEHTSFAGDDSSEADAGPGTPESNRTIEDNGATSSGSPANSDGYDDQFNAHAPSGVSWAGTVASWAHKDANQCRWNGYILKTS